MEMSARVEGGSGFIQDIMPRICLLGAEQEVERLELLPTLQRLGYTRIDCWDPAVAFNSDGRSDTVYVGLIGGNSHAQASLKEFIRDNRVYPVLGILIDESPRGNALVSYNDFVTWPCKSRELEIRLQRLRELLPAPRLPRLSAEILDEFLSMNLVGSSPEFLDVLHRVKRIAGHDVAVSIYGETGTGKELIAKALHYLSPRAGGPFIPVNCGGLPDTLLENELFGHEEGAYTDARGRHAGLISEADGGTLFLDEVEAMSPKAQVSLLRFLQDKQYRPLGGKALKAADVRIVAASNVRLEDLRRGGAFREDLFFRLNIMPLMLPPLRARSGDVLLLAEHFMSELRGQYSDHGKALHHSAQRWLLHNDWPGNVRELQNTLHRAFLLTESDVIYTKHLRLEDAENLKFVDDEAALFDLSFNDARHQVVLNFEKEYLAELLRRAGGNVTQAAKLAMKERRAMGRLLKKHNLTGIDLHNT
jgi:DNA-binding NtrC family response regulator